jgi:hypothetical protein
MPFKKAFLALCTLCMFFSATKLFAEEDNKPSFESIDDGIRYYLAEALENGQTYDLAIDYVNKANSLAQESGNKKYIDDVSKVKDVILTKPIQYLVATTKGLGSRNFTYIKKLFEAGDSDIFYKFNPTKIPTSNGEIKTQGLFIEMALDIAIAAETKMDGSPLLKRLLIGSPEVSYYDSVLYQAISIINKLQCDQIHNAALLTELITNVAYTQALLILNNPTIQGMDAAEFFSFSYPPLQTIFKNVSETYIKIRMEEILDKTSLAPIEKSGRLEKASRTLELIKKL